MIPLSFLPGLNAALNSASALFLVSGYLFIRGGKIAAHKLCMLAAFITSALFLMSYLTYHYQVGSVRFQGQGWIRLVYFAVLLSHTVLAVAIVPLVLATLARALKGNFAGHKRLARRTLPLWLYVSITGVIVYWMLYRF
ncbi:MAG: DUF420 domain-containing protein [Deltaproteobacteria bacterium]|nr:DUF420 domain-containing protein [Deltaproteobacteria bacterium]